MRHVESREGVSGSVREREAAEASRNREGASGSVREREANEASRKHQGEKLVRHTGSREGERKVRAGDNLIRFPFARSDKSVFLYSFFIHSFIILMLYVARGMRSKTVRENAVFLVILSFLSLPSSTHYKM